MLKTQSKIIKIDNLDIIIELLDLCKYCSIVKQETRINELKQSQMSNPQQDDII